MNPKISEFIETSKRIDFAKIHAISTNGVLIQKMEDRFFEAVDYIFVALYPALSKLKPKLTQHLSEQAKIHNFKFNVASRSHFYNIETCEKLPDDIARASYNNCDRIKKGPFFENGYFYKCMRPVTTKEYLQNRGYAGNVVNFNKTDGVEIHAPFLKERITAYMASKEPLESCYFCKMGLKDESNATLWRKTKSYFEDVKFVKNIIYRSKTLLSACHAMQGIFEKSFVRKANANSLDIGVPLVPHRMLTREECTSRTKPTT